MVSHDCLVQNCQRAPGLGPQPSTCGLGAEPDSRPSGDFCAGGGNTNDGAHAPSLVAAFESLAHDLDLETGRGVSRDLHLLVPRYRSPDYIGSRADQKRGRTTPVASYV